MSQTSFSLSYGAIPAASPFGPTLMICTYDDDLPRCSMVCQECAACGFGKGSGNPEEECCKRKTKRKSCAKPRRICKRKPATKRKRMACKPKRMSCKPRCARRKPSCPKRKPSCPKRKPSCPKRKPSCPKRKSC